MKLIDDLKKTDGQIKCSQVATNEGDMWALQKSGKWEIPASEKCEAIETGFCHDVDECSELRICEAGASCSNSCGDYECACDDDRIGKNCQKETPQMELSLEDDTIDCADGEVCLIPSPTGWSDDDVKQIMTARHLKYEKL